MSDQRNKHTIKLDEYRKKLAAQSGMSHEEIVSEFDKIVNAVNGISERMTMVFLEEVRKSGLESTCMAAMGAPLTFLMHIFQLINKSEGAEPNVLWPNALESYERLLRLVVMIKPAYKELPWVEFEKLIQRRYKDMGNECVDTSE